MNQKPKYFSRLVGRACILNDVSDESLEKLQAAKKKYETGASLDDRGKFPVGLVSQPDVLALQSVILTTGRPGNLNDDVILNEEVLPILFTAAFKPFNIEHTKFIIGTMFDAFAVDKDTGKVVQSIEKFNEEESDEDREQERTELQSVVANFPENLDIVTNQVLWSLHFPEQVRDVKRKAIAGEFFVSMEIWFTNFDYLIGNRVVKRTPLLAEALDSKLRINGGSGFFGIDRIKRIPRNLTFAGNAAVETPANPNSFILDVMDRSDLVDQTALEVEEVEAIEANVQNSVQQMIVDNTLYILEGLSDEAKTSEDLSDADNIGRSDELSMDSEAFGAKLVSAEVDEVVTHSDGEKVMENDKVVELLEKNAVLQSNLDKSEVALAEANTDKEELQATKLELEAKLEETLALVKEAEDALVTKAEAFEKLEAEKAELDSKLEETSAELTEIEEARKLDARKAILAGIGLSEDRVVKTLAKTAELSNEEFEVELEDIKAFMVELTPEVTEVPSVVKTEEVKVTEVIEVEVEASEEELSEVLEEVEEEEAPVAEAVGTVVVEENDETETLQSAMAKVLGINL